jgi:lambda repressor-like predicted transcriptional regulator
VNRTRWIATAAAGLAVVVGGGAALAASGSSNPAADFTGDVAKRLGISKDRLEGAIEDATIARIDAAVAAGDITKEEGEALKERVRSGDVPGILPGFAGPAHELGAVRPPGVPAPGPFAGSDPLDTAADYLGIDEADIRRALRDGKSLADLAKDRGKSVDGLEDALRDEIRRAADRAADDGALTREQANRLAEKLSGAVDELVEKGATPGLGFGFRGPRFGPGPLGPLGKGMLPGPFPGSDLMERAADYLGMTGAGVREALRDGKSLADLAKDEGRSVDGLKKALREEIREDVLTEEQADLLAERLGSVMDRLVESGLRNGLDFDFEGGEGKFEFHLRIAPGRAACLGAARPDVLVQVKDVGRVVGVLQRRQPRELLR